MSVDQQQPATVAARRPWSALRGFLALPLCAGWLASVLMLDGASGSAARVWLVVSGWLVLAPL